MIKLNTKIVRNGKVVSESNPIEHEEGKHVWTDSEDKICSRECIIDYVIEKKSTSIKDMTARLSKMLPRIRELSIHDKILNIKAIFEELSVENTLCSGKLVNYSEQNLVAVKWILKCRGISFKE